MASNATAPPNSILQCTLEDVQNDQDGGTQALGRLQQLVGERAVLPSVSEHIGCNASRGPECCLGLPQLTHVRHPDPVPNPACPPSRPAQLQLNPARLHVW